MQSRKCTVSLTNFSFNCSIRVCVRAKLSTSFRIWFILDIVSKYMIIYVYDYLCIWLFISSISCSTSQENLLEDIINNTRPSSFSLTGKFSSELLEDWWGHSKDSRGKHINSFRFYLGCFDVDFGGVWDALIL